MSHRLQYESFYGFYVIEKAGNLRSRTRKKFNKMMLRSEFSKRKLTQPPRKPDESAAIPRATSLVGTERPDPEKDVPEILDIKWETVTAGNDTVSRSALTPMVADLTDETEDDTADAP